MTTTKSTNCTRCGKCCKAIPCSIGLFTHGDHRPCKALKLTNNTYHCDIITNPHKHLKLNKHKKWKSTFIKKLFSHIIGLNMGCCTSPQNEALYNEIRKNLLLKKIKL